MSGTRQAAGIHFRREVADRNFLPRATVRPLRPKLGHIDFLNCMPLLWGLARTGILYDVELIRDSPERLSDSLVSGALEIGPISLYEFLRHSDELIMLPDIAIGSDGPVMSCLIISKVPLEQLDGARVALGSASRTSIQLARLLLTDHVGVRPEFFGCRSDLAAMLETAEAAVVIGDVALRAGQQAAELGLRVYDLGELWRDWTDLPFVFAVLAARRDFAERRPEDVSRTHRALVTARDLGSAQIRTICREVAQWEEFSEELLFEYYTRALDFTLGGRQLDGIAEFARRLAGQGAEFPAGPSPRLFEAQ
ncbi:menaquinone biosynthesis protein [Nocardia sp. SYP-A9097]|nr:menaquinone biosynthesis protein [Nocardia sp. SYP-A9097]